MSAYDDPFGTHPRFPAPEPAVDTPRTADAHPSPAAERFHSCRWRRPAENSSPECCSHRDVLPLAGAHGFDAEAWCAECGFYKLRRTPKKRGPDEYFY